MNRGQEVSGYHECDDDYQHQQSREDMFVQGITTEAAHSKGVTFHAQRHRVHMLSTYTPAQYAHVLAQYHTNIPHSMQAEYAHVHVYPLPSPLCMEYTHATPLPTQYTPRTPAHAHTKHRIQPTRIYRAHDTDKEPGVAHKKQRKRINANAVPTSSVWEPGRKSAMPE